MTRPILTGLLVRLRHTEGEPLAAAVEVATGSLGHLGFGPAEPLFEVAAAEGGEMGFAAEPAAAWYRFALEDTAEATAWDRAHAAADRLAAARTSADGPYVEPDLEHAFLTRPPEGGLAVAGGKGVVDPPDRDLPFLDKFAWFLDDEFSQLASARRAVGGGDERVRIAHLDTGYDDRHRTLPAHLLTALQRNFVAGEAKDDARDPGRDEPGPFDHPGHGTGTLGILAGGQVEQLGDFLGGAPEAEVVPIRIARSVVLLRTSALAKALDYIAAGGSGASRLADVVSLSMGGLASRAWADAVNKAYEAGVCIVAAAGNNLSVGFGGVPTRFLVYPARFRRVIAACGLMANQRPYHGLPFGKLQGNWGPASAMATALAAYTPNLPWAEHGAPDVIDLDGAGTSSATPQIAAAAALWLARHRAAVAAYAHPWQRVEAVRHALFRSAEKSADPAANAKLGNGALRAGDALEIAPAQGLVKTPPDSAAFAFLRLLFGFGLAAGAPRAEMLAVEAAQLAQQEARPAEPMPFEEILADPDLPPSSLQPEQVRRFVESLIQHPRASEALRQHLAQLHASHFGGTAGPPRRRRRTKPSDSAPPPPDAGATALRPRRHREGDDPPHRRLRGYAIDPSLAQRLDTALISTVTFSVPWEETLAPGPTGEYLEVIDYDPASKCFYEPVDLNKPSLLAQDGLAPSEGTPQFHQQMVYAVASLTIQHFERALGRRALWSPGPPPAGTHFKNDSHFVRRLRVYPHALRTANAYYSPLKKALLFGYYAASEDDPGGHMPGGRVFTCLSHDVVAHETTHALLDGMHRRLIQPSNPDVLAFHEAFADVVALFQHFTLPEIVRHQMAKTRGDIRLQHNLLGELAGEFGRTSGRGDALRSAIGARNAEGIWQPHTPDPAVLNHVFRPHDRGAVLVAAVFDAFFSIYESRTADLLRLATGGSGVLQAGALPPDLVNRLAQEACKTARHVLTMCVRALDYCPPVDLTFGEYLRALVTADADLVHDDDRGYRVAFVEAFRRRGIYPSNLRTLSAESLRWTRPEDGELQPSSRFEGGLGAIREWVDEHDPNGSREQTFHLSRELRRRLHGWLVGHFIDRSGRRDARGLGIDPERSFEVHSFRLAHRIGPDGRLLRQALIDVLQEVRMPLDPSDRRGHDMIVEGGCTLVVDLEKRALDYCIRKSTTSPSRHARQRDYLQRFSLGIPEATYFGVATALREPVARLHSGT